MKSLLKDLISKLCYKCRQRIIYNRIIVKQIKSKEDDLRTDTNTKRRIKTRRRINNVFQVLLDYVWKENKFPFSDTYTVKLASVILKFIY